MMNSEDLKTLVIESYPTGSREICDPPTNDTDKDDVVLVTNLGQYVDIAKQCGCTSDTEYAGEYFISLRLGEYNIIATEKKEFYDKFVFATKIAKKMNLLKKEDRITLFQAILYNKIEE